MPPRDGFCRVEAMLEGVLIALRSSRGRSAMHPTSAVRYRRGSARGPAPRSGSAARGEMHVTVMLNSGGLGLVLIAGAGFASLFSSVALVEEFVEWRRHTEALPLKRLLLPPAS